MEWFVIGLGLAAWPETFGFIDLILSFVGAVVALKLMDWFL